MDCSPPGSSVHGIVQARILEWVAIALFQGTFLTQLLNPSLLHLLHCRWILYCWVSGKAHGLILGLLNWYKMHREDVPGLGLGLRKAWWFPFCISFGEPQLPHRETISPAWGEEPQPACLPPGVRGVFPHASSSSHLWMTPKETSRTASWTVNPQYLESKQSGCRFKSLSLG